jgi:HK97 family phage major capsid protein
LEKTCAVANAPDGAAGFALNPQTRAWLRQKPRGTGLNYCWDDGERNLLGHRVGVTANLPSDLDKGTSVGVCSSLIFSCDWKQLWLCWYGPLAVDVLTDRYSRAPEGKLVITAAMLVGAGVAQPAAFAKMDDCLLS